MGKICKLFINKNSKMTLIISSIIFVLFMIVVLPIVSDYTQELTGSNLSPDTSIFYSSSELFDMADEYGKEGRSAYINLRFTFDIVWPIVYFMFLASLTCVLVNSNKHKEKYKNLVLLPILGVIFDFLENIASSIVMYNYPVKMVFFAELAPFMTLFKWIFIGLSFAAIIVLTIMHIINSFKKH